MHNPYQFPQDGLQSEDVPAVTDGKAKVEIMAGAPVGSTQVSRRAFLGGAMTIAGGALALSFLAHLSTMCCQARSVWISGVGPVTTTCWCFLTLTSVVIMMQNELCQELPVRVKAGDKVIA